MIKNAIIAVQSLALLLVLAWYVSYKHEILQMFHVASLGFMANETRLLLRLGERLDRGETEETRRIIRQIVAANVEEMKNSVAALDLSKSRRVDHALEAAALVEDAGITEIADLIERRAAEQGGSH